jgi:hypothetical protein
VFASIWTVVFSLLSPPSSRGEARRGAQDEGVSKSTETQMMNRVK